MSKNILRHSVRGQCQVSSIPCFAETGIKRGRWMQGTSTSRSTRKHLRVALVVFFSCAGLPGMSGNIIDISHWKKVELFKTPMWACGGNSYSPFLFFLCFRNSGQETGKLGSDDRTVTLHFDVSSNTAIGQSCAAIAPSLSGGEGLLLVPAAAFPGGAVSLALPSQTASTASCTFSRGSWDSLSGGLGRRSQACTFQCLPFLFSLGAGLPIGHVCPCLHGQSSRRGWEDSWLQP